MSYLTDDQKKALLEQRLAQFASEKYQHELNLKLGEAVNDPASVQQAQAAITVLDTAIALHEQELNGLGE